jgi:hypothetical protein
MLSSSMTSAGEPSRRYNNHDTTTAFLACMTPSIGPVASHRPQRSWQKVKRRQCPAASRLVAPACLSRSITSWSGCMAWLAWVQHGARRELCKEKGKKAAVSAPLPPRPRPAQAPPPPRSAPLGVEIKDVVALCFTSQLA